MNTEIILRNKKLFMKYAKFEKSKKVLGKQNKSDLLIIYTQKIR